MTITGETAPEASKVRVLVPAPEPPPRRNLLRRWSGLVREVGVVVAGILIAFSLDAWWDTRREKLSQEAQLRALHEEFTANRERIDQAEERHDDISLRSRALLSALQLHPAGSDVQVADSLLASVFEWRTQPWSTGTIEALIASGTFGRSPIRSYAASWPTGPPVWKRSPRINCWPATSCTRSPYPDWRSRRTWRTWWTPGASR